MIAPGTPGKGGGLAKPPAEIRDFILSHARFVVLGHREPDGDCVASQLALRALLHAMGREASLYSVGPFDRPEIEQFAGEFAGSIPKEVLEAPGTAVVIVDCSTPDRTGELGGHVDGLPCLVVDHHSSGERFGTLRYVEPRAASTSMLVFSLFESLGVVPGVEQARLLLFGLCTDTGFFRHLDTGSAEAFRMIARLAEQGTTTAEVFLMVYGRRDLGSRKLLARMLERTESHCGGALLLSWQTIEDRRMAGRYQRGEDDLYRLLQTVQGCQVVVFIREETEGRLSVSLRSTTAIDVGRVAASFGGGGHRQAAGFESAGTREAVREAMLSTFAALLSC
jgi:bifunctional oligoribonuclease and PAP phosphatase NrnA